MKSNYVQNQLNYIDYIFNEMDKQTLDPFVKSLISQYLAALICGIYEDAIEDLLAEFVQTETTSIELKNFISESIGRAFRNPDKGKIIDLLKSFNPTWGKQLESTLQPQNWHALQTIYDNKNCIAHGKISNITYSQVKQSFQESRIIIEEIDSLLL